MTDKTPAIKTVLDAINGVQKDLSQTGIAKEDRNEHGRYNFRGIDALYNTLSPLLAKHGLVIVPQCKKCKVEQQYTSNNKLTHHAQVMVKFVVYGPEGDCVIAEFPGEALDTSDKSINKAMTAAYKYLMFELFCIPVEGSPDADAEHIQLGEAPDIRRPLTATPPATPYGLRQPAYEHGQDGYAHGVSQVSPVPPAPEVQPQAPAQNDVVIVDEEGAFAMVDSLVAMATSMHAGSKDELKEFWRMNKHIIDVLDTNFKPQYEVLKDAISALATSIEGATQ